MVADVITGVQTTFCSTEDVEADDVEADELLLTSWETEVDDDSDDSDDIDEDDEFKDESDECKDESDEVMDESDEVMDESDEDERMDSKKIPPTLATVPSQDPCLDISSGLRMT